MLAALAVRAAGRHAFCIAPINGVPKQKQMSSIIHRKQKARRPLFATWARTLCSITNMVAHYAHNSPTPSYLGTPGSYPTVRSRSPSGGLRSPFTARNAERHVQLTVIPEKDHRRKRQQRISQADLNTVQNYGLAEQKGARVRYAGSKQNLHLRQLLVPRSLLR